MERAERAGSLAIVCSIQRGRARACNIPLAARKRGPLSNHIRRNGHVPRPTENYGCTTDATRLHKCRECIDRGDCASVHRRLRRAAMGQNLVEHRIEVDKLFDTPNCADDPVVDALQLFVSLRAILLASNALVSASSNKQCYAFWSLAYWLCVLDRKGGCAPPFEPKVDVTSEVPSTE